MKKITILFLIFNGFANAQYFENFEKGVPSTMLQSFDKSQTTWIDFGLSAVNVDEPISGSNSAVFFNAMTQTEVTTSLQTPVLDFSKDDMVLEFKYLQKQKTENYANILTIELSNDLGKTWREVAIFDKTTNEVIDVSIDLRAYKPESAIVMRFRAKQANALLGHPIVIDDISIKPIDQIFLKNSARATGLFSDDALTIYPNPSNGFFTISNTQNVDVTIFDINGRTVYSQIELGKNANIDLTKLAKGTYFAQIKTKAAQQIKKLTIQ